MAKHVDDPKLRGPRDAALNVTSSLEEHFEALNVTRHHFTNCGVQRTQNVKTKDITLDQDTYIQNARCISHRTFSTAPVEES